MSKTKRKSQTNNFVRGVRAETAIRSYTTALGYFQTRPHEVAVKMTQERIDFARAELVEVNRRRREAEEETRAAKA